MRGEQKACTRAILAVAGVAPNLKSPVPTPTPWSLELPGIASGADRSQIYSHNKPHEPAIWPPLPASGLRHEHTPPRPATKAPVTPASGTNARRSRDGRIRPSKQASEQPPPHSPGRAQGQTGSMLDVRCPPSPEPPVMNSSHAISPPNIFSIKAATEEALRL